MGKKKILIVDDEAAFAGMVKRNLEETGSYHVEIERFGTQALQAAQRFQPDLILLDMIMPDLDGEEVLKRIRAHEPLKATPVVFLSAYFPETSSGNSPAKTGSEGVMVASKPITSGQLLRIIEDHLQDSA